MVKQTRQGKASKASQDENLSRKPAWREQAPAKPRKRVKRKPMAVSGSSGRAEGRAATGRIPLAMPSRETWLLTLRVAALLLTAIAVTIGLLYLLRWPQLSVSRGSTQIGGNLRLTPEEIYVASQIDGKNVLVLRADDIADEVKKAPGIAAAEVHVRLPNQVIIDVHEHAPLVAWQSITSTVWLAADGAEIPQAGGAPPLTFTDQSEGRLDKDAALRKLMLENLGAVHTARPELSEFYYADEPGLYYQAPEGWQVWLGESGPLEQKLALAEAAGQDIAKQGARPKVIDVRQSERKAMWW
jgi:hypothetical protein